MVTKTKTKTKSKVSAQHAKAGRLGGLAPHVCRGRQCTSAKYKSKMSKAKK